MGLALALAAGGAGGVGPARALDDTIGEPELGRALVARHGCAQCHGAGGAGIEPGWPRLAGQYALYLTNQLENFITGRRPHPFMERLAGGLTRAEMAAIASYYACQHADLAGDRRCRGARD